MHRRIAPPPAAALRPALRARRLRRRVRRGRGRPVARSRPAARARRASPRSATAARSGPTASRATAPGSPCRSSGRSLDELVAGPGVARRRPAIVLRLFLPRGRARPGARRGRSSRTRSRAEGLAIAAWRTRARRRRARSGRGGRGSRPDVRAGDRRRRPAARRPPISDAAFERRLVLARRRARRPPRARRRSTTSPSPSASCRTIVYKGLVAGGRLGRAVSRTSRDRCRCRYAMFHQRYATNTHPTWRLAQPFRLARPQRRDQHRPRQPRAGPRPGAATAAAAAALAAELVEAGPLLVAGRLRLAVARRGARAARRDRLGRSWPALLAADPRGARRCGGRRTRTWRTLRRRTAGFLAPWDGPAAIVFTDGRRVGALLDRNGLRPAAFAVTRDRLVAVASEAGAVPLDRGRDRAPRPAGPGRDAPRRPAPAARSSRTPTRRPRLAAHARRSTTRRGRRHDDRSTSRRRSTGRSPDRRPALPLPRRPRRRAAPARHQDDGPRGPRAAVEHGRRHADAGPRRASTGRSPTTSASRSPRSRTRRSIPSGSGSSWTCGSSSAAGRRSSAARPRAAATRPLRLARPIVADLDGLLEAVRARGPGGRRLDATWDARPTGAAGSRRALERLAATAVGRRASAGAVAGRPLRPRASTLDRLPVPSVLAVGAVHTALTEAGLRGRTDIVADAADVLDVHALAMVLAAGATGRASRGSRSSWRRELAGTRGAEELSRPDAVAQPPRRLRGRPAQDARPDGHQRRRVVRRRGARSRPSTSPRSSSPGASRRRRPGRAGRPSRPRRRVSSRRAERGAAIAARTPPGREPRCPTRASPASAPTASAISSAPRIVGEIQAPRRAASGPASDAGSRPLPRGASAATGGAGRRPRRAARPAGSPPAADRARRGRAGARDRPPVRRVGDERRGALSPEAHQALTIGIQRAGGAANTGEGGEDPAWYVPDADGRRHDAAIKQVASARFGVTADLPRPRRAARDQDRPGLQAGRGRPAARRRRRRPTSRRCGAARPASRYISPPPHHDIYSIEDLAQLIADLRAINPARPDRRQARRRARRRHDRRRASPRPAPTTSTSPATPAGPARRRSARSSTSARRGSSASPRSTRSLLRNGLRDRVALRTDGGLQTGRDLLVAALLGAEEFAFGTAALVAIGCDMARQCHLDTCPTGIATQREDLRAKFAGTPGAGRALRHSPSPRTSGASWRRSAPGRSARSSARRRRLAARRSRRSTSDARRCVRAIAGAGPAGRRPRVAPDPAARRSRSVAARCRRRRSRRRLAAALRRPGAIRRRRPPDHDRRAIVRRRADGRDRARRAPRPGPAARCAGAAGQSLRGVRRPRGSSCGSPARPTTTSARACPAARSSSRPEPDARRRAGDARRSPATPASTARPAAGSTSSAARGCASRSATAAPTPSSRASGRTAAST